MKLYRKLDKVFWRDGDDLRKEVSGVLVAKKQDGNRRNIWTIKLTDNRVVHAFEGEFRAAT